MDQDTTTRFLKTITDSYSCNEPSLTLGCAKLDDQLFKEAQVKLPLRMFNRHGLITGATGTGKTVTLQLMAQKLSDAGVPVLVMDMKGDLSGLAVAGTINDRITQRAQALGLVYEPAASPVEFLTLTPKTGTRLRATVSEFGPVLFSRVLGLNDTQSGIITILFKYADDNGLPLLDLKDFMQLLQYAGGEGKKEIQAKYGNISPASLSTILRAIVEIEAQGGNLFFGEKSFEVEDLMRMQNGKGVVSVIRLEDMQDRPRLFSTFMLSLLAEIYGTLPERGDADKPLLCIFIDEAHLVFDDAPKALLDQVEIMVRLIRSKGVGLFFVTQHPTDVPEEILAQLGLKVQHALRAFTEKDRRAIRKTAENYPTSSFYKIDQLLTTLGIGEALVTGLDGKGRPTPVAAVHLEPPAGRIGILKDAELQEIFSRSTLCLKYNEEIDRESAFEILNKKLRMAGERTENPQQKQPGRKDRTLAEKAGESLAREAGRTIARELTRGLLGALGLGRRRRSGWL